MQMARAHVLAILPRYLMDITIQQLPYNITSIIKSRN